MHLLSFPTLLFPSLFFLRVVASFLFHHSLSMYFLHFFLFRMLLVSCICSCVGARFFFQRVRLFVRLFLQIPLVCVAFFCVAFLHVISVFVSRAYLCICAFSLSLFGRTFVKLCALRTCSADVYPHSLFSLSHCVLTCPHALQLVREELQVIIPTITFVCVNLCLQRFYLSPPPRTTLKVSSPQSRFLFVFVSSF